MKITFDRVMGGAFAIFILVMASMLGYFLIEEFNKEEAHEETIITDVKVYGGFFSKWYVLFGNSSYNNRTYFNINEHYALGSWVAIYWYRYERSSHWKLGKIRLIAGEENV